MLDGSVLLSGDAGYIGNRAVRPLLDESYRVVVFDHLSTGFDWMVDPRAILITFVVEDENFVRGAMLDRGGRAVMHFADSIIVAASVSDSVGYHRNNTVTSRALLKSAVISGVRHFIFSSAAATQGKPERIPVAETDPSAPINSCGTLTMMTEAMLRDVTEMHPMNYTTLLYFNFAGADSWQCARQLKIGAMDLMKIAVGPAVDKREPVGIYGTDYGTPKGIGERNYIHATYVSAAHVGPLERLITGPLRGYAVNAGYSPGFSMLGAVDTVTDRTLDRRIESCRYGDPAAPIASNRAILATLGCMPQQADHSTIVADAFAWERKLDQVEVA